jgi:hypothetical protein
VTRPADHSDSNSDAGQPYRVPPMADRLAQLRTLLDALSARAQQLRTLHEQYKALQPEEAGDERREKLMRMLNAELDVLGDSQRVHEQIDEFLRMERELLGTHSPRETAHPPARTPDAPDAPDARE